MTTFIAATGSFLTFIGFLVAQKPNADFTSLFFQGLIIVAPYILFSSCLLLILLRRAPVLSDWTVSKANRYTSVSLTALLFILPFGTRVLLNDALFIVFDAVICWCWISWAYFMEIGVRNRP